MKRIASQAGETIVEVLIAMAVIASSLGIAFASASKSTKGIQANKDRYQGQLYANQQADLLRANTSNSAIRTSIAFCFDATPSFTTTLSSCQRDSLYNITIQCSSHCNAVDTYSTYKIHVEWDSDKAGTDSVEVFYGT
jgi:type II secretory pathway pseudopilin PulG